MLCGFTECASGACLCVRECACGCQCD